MNCKGIRDRIWSFADEFSNQYKNPLEKYWGGHARTLVESNIQHQFDSYVRMMQWILAKENWEDDECICFWIQSISRATNVLYGDCDGFIPFLSYVVEAAVQAEDYTVPYLAEAALALEVISLNHSDLFAALEWAKFIIVSLQSVNNISETVFRSCFNYYQYICRAISDGSEYWEEPGFEELSSWIKKMFEIIIDGDSIEEEEHNIWILSHGDCTITTDEAIELIYADYCYKISEEGVDQERSLFEYAANSPTDITAILESVAMRFLPKGSDVSDLPLAFQPEETFELSEEETHLLKYASSTEKYINGIIDSEVFSSEGLWLVMRQREYSAKEKEEMHKKLLACDSKQPYFEPQKLQRTTFVYKLAQMECAFSYAYALVSDWDAYAFHVSNLINYYKILIWGRQYNTHFRRSGAADLKHLPGATSLLNFFCSVLPSNLAHNLLENVISIMEDYHMSQRFDFGDFCELYQKAMELAKDSGNLEATSKWEHRISCISAVFFSEKGNE